MIKPNQLQIQIWVLWILTLPTKARRHLMAWLQKFVLTPKRYVLLWLQKVQSDIYYVQTFVVSYSLLALHINKFMVVVLVFQLTAMLYLKKDIIIFLSLQYSMITSISSLGTAIFLAIMLILFFETQCWIFTPAFSRLKNGIQTAY